MISYYQEVVFASLTRVTWVIISLGCLSDISVRELSAVILHTMLIIHIYNEREVSTCLC